MFVKQCISYKYCVPRCSLDKVLGVEIKQTEPARPRCIARDFLGFRIAEPLRSRAWNRSDTTIQLPKHETSNHWPSGEPPEDLRPATEDQPDIEETLVHRSALLDFSEQRCVGRESRASFLGLNLARFFLTAKLMLYCFCMAESRAYGPVAHDRQYARVL